MRTLLVSAAALLAVAFVPAPAQAHLCGLDDPVCLVNCILHDRLQGHPCSVHAMDPPGFAPCDAGQSGTVATVGSRTVRACVGVPDVTAGACPPGTVGVVVYVDGRPTEVCVGLA